MTVPETNETPTLNPAQQRALALAEEVRDKITDLFETLTEMSLDVQMLPEEIYQLCREQIAEEDDINRMLLWHAFHLLYPVAALKMGDTPIQRMLGRLFDQAPKLTDGRGAPVSGQSPALPDCMIVLRNGPPMQGVLSTTPEGGLRMMSAAAKPVLDPSGQPRPGMVTPIMVEQFFDISDVVNVTVLREDLARAAQQPKIVG